MRSVWRVALLFLCVGPACDDAKTTDCGTGGRAVLGDDGRPYCVYGGAPDRTCPEAYPWNFVVDATLVCSEVRITDVAQLPANVCDAIGENACEVEPDDDGGMDAGRDAGPDDGDDASVPPDAGRRDVGVACGDDAGSGLTPDGDLACPSEVWEAAAPLVVGANLGDHVTIATSESCNDGFVHVGLVVDGHAMIITRELADVTRELDPPLDDVSGRWDLLGDRAIALRRDGEGDVAVLVLHDGAGDDPGVRASTGRIPAGGAIAALASPGRVIGPEGETTLGRAAVIGGSHGVPTRFGWRLRRDDGPPVMASVGADLSPSGYREAIGDVSSDDSIELRGTGGRVMLAPIDLASMTLWDTRGTETTVIPTPGRISRADIVAVSATEHIIGYHDGTAAQLRRVVCTEVRCSSGVLMPIAIGGEGAHTVLASIGGTLALGFGPPTADVGAGIVVQLVTPTFEQIPGTRRTPPTPPTMGGRRLHDAAIEVVRHRGELHLVIAALISSFDHTRPTDAYVTGIRFPATCP